MDTRRERTKDSILRAMVTCLQDQNFNDITTSHLAKTAGVSRSSFYTHYRDKFELIESYQQTLFYQLEVIFDNYKGDPEASFLEIFQFLDREELLAALLSPHGTQEIQQFLINKVRLLVSRDLSLSMNKEEWAANEKEYRSIYFSHAFFGLVQSWIAKGKSESPEEMTQILLKLLP
ncbi:TetR/AcrR family transcriptional regulator [Streptococcus suis]|uniref:TetR/AcrR family transcriptional regulator n=1 Tax=Streptococcus suis TaxID=1307 RepID=A0A4T2GPM6_STRSU|nr:TetR/AcrR family transcriptional regulator [Streptococcus suis]MBM7269909.1 TetR/AcrR family transcriptional regulator [Streptococcus suis]TIH99800.1 TetR/AcrR family transcriptional regulator [Streptococcus suis]